jgi:hypothetical protein
VRGGNSNVKRTETVQILPRAKINDVRGLDIERDNPHM